MLAVVHIQLDFDLQLSHQPGPVPTFDGVDSRSVTAILRRGSRQSLVQVLSESEGRLKANPVEGYNQLEIVFRRDEFNRRQSEDWTPGGTQIEYAANDFLNRLAYFTGAAAISPIRLERCAWKLEYLNDDRTELPIEEDKFRGRESMIISGGATVIGGPAFWAGFEALPCNFSVPAWHPLLAQAERAMPDVGNALLLAAIGLEVFAELTVSEQARHSQVPEALWRWIASRNAGRGPSTTDHYSILLEVACGRSLKTSSRLWTALRHILDARNSFAHTGQAFISDSQVSEAQARELLGFAKEIVSTVNAWVGKEGIATMDQGSR